MGSIVTGSASQVIRVPPSFSLATAVCSYGFFMLAPNRWLRESSTFERPLHTLASGPVRVRVTQEAAGALRMTASATLSTAELEDLRRQVVRMLRLAEADFEAVAAFQALHAAARAEGFGHLLRSPSMWEDAVKSITLCNCGWGRTLGMNAALCGELGGGAFPTPAQVIAAGPEALQSKCGVGYRARTICALAQQVLDGTAAALEQQAATGITSDELHKGLLRLAGMGPFTGANMLELLGRFDRVPCDTETARHLAKAHGVSGGVSDAKKLQAAAQRVYAAYAPYQFLAYWFEIRQDYDALFGSLVDMDPADYAKATGHHMRAHGGQKTAAAACTTSAGPLQAMGVATPAAKERRKKRVSRDALADIVEGASAAAAVLGGRMTRSRAAAMQG